MIPSQSASTWRPTTSDARLEVPSSPHHRKPPAIKTDYADTHRHHTLTHTHTHTADATAEGRMACASTVCSASRFEHTHSGSWPTGEKQHTALPIDSNTTFGKGVRPSTPFGDLVSHGFRRAEACSSSECPPPAVVGSEEGRGTLVDSGRRGVVDARWGLARG